jgi:tetratricopeptide (TPR) repeat protein
MIHATRLSRALAAACLCACISSSAALTEAEKQLLSSSISQQSALAMGKAMDAAALERIIALGDPNLVSYFWSGTPDQAAMPPDIEALVIKHFDDPKVGEMLRNFRMRYQTRALFDRFHALTTAAYRARDPVWERILRTDQRGIEEDVLRIANRFPGSPGELNPALRFLGERRYPGAVPALVASIESGIRPGSIYNLPLDMLLRYESVEVWKKAESEVERLKREGRMDEKSYANARKRFDTVLADPQTYLAQMRSTNALADFTRRRRAIELAEVPSENSRTQSARYVEERARYLEKADALASEYRDAGVELEMANDYATLGIVARMRAGDTTAAIKFLERSARGGSGLGQLALGDAYELGLGDKANAVRAYQQALESAKSPKTNYKSFGTQGSPVNEFWKAWLATQIEYLRTGKPYRGQVSEGTIMGFWDAMRAWRYSMRPSLPDLPYAVRRAQQRIESAPTYGAVALDATPRQAEWADIDNLASTANAPDLPERLAAMPASRFVFIVAMQQISVLKSPDAILKEYSRHDPGGFWATIVFATVNFHETKGRDGALADGVAVALPGMSAPERPNALAIAARRYLNSREARATEKK